MFGKGKIRKLESKIEYLEIQLKNREPDHQENLRLQAENSAISARNRELDAKVKIQTEADIYFESMKIMKNLEGGAKVSDVQPQIDFRTQLQEDLARQQQLSRGLGNGLMGALMGRF